MDADMSPETDTRDRVIRSEGKIDYLVKAFEDFVKDSKESRSRMYRELEDARSNATSIKLEMEDLKEKFDKAHLTIVAIEKWKERAIGAGILVAVICGAIGGAVGLFWKWIATKFGI
jgi:predicted  nucleic acid-binding Zn-ribbon protein